MLIVIADIGWIIATALVIWFGSHLLKDGGVLMIKIVALFVAVFAIAQYVGARRIQQLASRVAFHSRDKSFIATVKRKVRASVDNVWEVMTDHPGYAYVATNLSKVEVLTGDGLGMQRRCYGPKGENWTETCDQFDDGRSYGFRVHTEAHDYPYPFHDVRGLWSLAPDEVGSEFSVDIEVTPKGGWLMKKLIPLMAKRQFTPILIDLADAWSNRMEIKETGRLS